MTSTDLKSVFKRSVLRLSRRLLEVKNFHLRSDFDSQNSSPERVIQGYFYCLIETEFPDIREYVKRELIPAKKSGRIDFALLNPSSRGEILAGLELECLTGRRKGESEQDRESRQKKEFAEHVVKDRERLNRNIRESGDRYILCFSGWDRESLVREVLAGQDLTGIYFGYLQLTHDPGSEKISRPVVIDKPQHWLERGLL